MPFCAACVRVFANAHRPWRALWHIALLVRTLLLLALPPVYFATHFLNVSGEPPIAQDAVSIGMQQDVRAAYVAVDDWRRLAVEMMGTGRDVLQARHQNGTMT